MVGLWLWGEVRMGERGGEREKERGIVRYVGGVRLLQLLHFVDC